MESVVRIALIDAPPVETVAVFSNGRIPFFRTRATMSYPEA